jgi:sialic acid synthase SpsE
MLDKLSLSDQDELILLRYCNNNGIKFLSTAFDRESLERLVSLGVDFVKIPSGEITNLPYLKFISTLDLPVLLSTGMSTMQEVAEALGILRHSRSNVKEVTVMQCTSAYPASLATVNLRVLAEFERQFEVKIGFSDHTVGFSAAMAAAALGASVIEKHFTMDKSAEGPDHSASLNPLELVEFVRRIREVELTLGTSIKQPQFDEIVNLIPIRRSIVASRRIEKGELFSEQNLACKRPSSGISPMEWEKVIGLPAKRIFQVDDIIEL